MTRAYASTEVRLQCCAVHLWPSTLDLFFAATAAAVCLFVVLLFCFVLKTVSFSLAMLTSQRAPGKLPPQHWGYSVSPLKQLFHVVLGWKNSSPNACKVPFTN